VKAQVGRTLLTFDFSRAAVKVKTDRLNARQVAQKVVSLFLDFMGTKGQIYGYIYVVMRPRGQTSTAASVVADAMTLRYEWGKCPTRINLDVPPVKPWDKHIPDSPPEQDQMVDVVVDIKRRNRDLDDEDIAVSVKGEYMFSGEFKPPIA